MRPFIESGPHGVGSRNRSLESCLRSKDSRAVRRGAVGKVPAKATRRRPTLPQARFWSRAAGATPSLRQRQRGANHCFLLTPHRDKAAAAPFLHRAIRTYGLPETITIDQSGSSNTAAIHHHNLVH